MRNKLKYWLLSDTHLGHDNLILKDYSDRPVDFEEKIKKNCLNSIKDNDILIFLGDYCIGNDKKWHNYLLGELKCKKWLIKGNHDRQSTTWYFNNGWDIVCDELILNIFGKRILFSHRPINADYFDLNIHGHCHNNDHRDENDEFRFSKKYKLVYLEHHYSPQNLQTFIGK